MVFSRWFKKSLEDVNSNLKNGEKLFQEAVALANLDRDRDAVEKFNESIEYFESPSAYLNRGASYQKLENFELALKDYEKAHQLEIADPTQNHNEIVNAVLLNTMAISVAMGSGCIESAVKERTLKDVLIRHENHKHGFFYSILHDLNFFRDSEKLYTKQKNIGLNNHEKELLMTYAYASRAVAAGMLIEGMTTIDQFKNIVQIFEATQQITIHSREFQIETCKKAVELIKSYDPSLRAENLSRVTFLATHRANAIHFPCQHGYSIEYSRVKEFLNGFNDAENITIDGLNDFIVLHGFKNHEVCT